MAHRWQGLYIKVSFASDEETMREKQPPRLMLREARGERKAHWCIVHDRREWSTGFGKGDREKAEIALDEYRAKTRRPQFSDGHPSKVKIGDCLSVYGEKHGPNSARKDGPAFEIDKLADFFGERVVDEITPELCDDYVAWRTAQRNARAKEGTGKPIAVSTAKRELVTLSAALNYCHATKRLDRAPIPIKMPDVGEPVERELSRDEVAALMWAALGWDQSGKRHPQRISRHLARFILIALYSGTRHSAVLKMQWMPNTVGGWFDLAAGVMHRRGRGAIETNKRRKPAPIPARLLPHLRRWRRMTSQYVIEWAGRPITSKIRRSWDTARVMAGLGPEATPHILKHTCATMMLEAGKTEWEVAAALSTTPQVIVKYYGSRVISHQRKTFDDVFSRRAKRPVPRQSRVKPA
jgi:integrase